MDNQIEEMSKVIEEAMQKARRTLGGYNIAMFYSEILHKVGYRKIPENAVVLTMEEYDELQICKDFNYGVHIGESNMTAYYENIILPEVRKETAEKFAERMKEQFADSARLCEQIDEIAKEIVGDVKWQVEIN